ncbi:hypothetical protein PCANC_19984 [Puccinia coronata f. sp. avenae]|uniref:Uncharacterized protein n=1 Tax=Puccinia coronata f. sp. avenae TaxID=200324 RepID=A0A2N5SQ20_9BASI|nr:hypothetical protein PCANC_19984 [Puccinia coronata f. sp. avenae]
MMPVLLSFVLIQLGLTFTVRALPLNATPITTVQSSSSDSSLLIESDLANALLYRDGGTEPDLGRNDGMQWQPSSLTVESDLQHDFKVPDVAQGHCPEKRRKIIPKTALERWAPFTLALENSSDPSHAHPSHVTGAHADVLLAQQATTHHQGNLLPVPAIPSYTLPLPPLSPSIEASDQFLQSAQLCNTPARGIMKF